LEKGKISLPLQPLKTQEFVEEIGGEERENKIKFSFGILEKLPNFATPFTTYGFRKRKSADRGMKTDLLKYHRQGCFARGKTGNKVSNIE